MPSPTLTSQVGAVRALHTLAHRLLRGNLTEEQLVFTLPNSSSHILWLTGHMAVTNDLALGPALGLQATLPREAAAMLTAGTRPVCDTATYEDFSNYRKVLLDSFERLAGHLDTVDEAKLAEPLPEGSALAQLFPYSGSLLSMWQFHTGYHLGQITLLRRAQGLEGGMGM